MTSTTPTGATPLKDTFTATTTTIPDLPNVTSLRVTGKVQVPSLGWTLDLKPAGQNSGATTLTLDLVATPPASAADPLPIEAGAEYDDPAFNGTATEVEIRFEGDSFTIPVQTFAVQVAARVQETESVAMQAVAEMSEES